VFGIATAVQASIPDASGVIHGCYFKFPNGELRQGALRVIDTGQAQRCRSDETVLNWNAVGPTGTRGATGPTGPTGPAGIAGPTSLASGAAIVGSQSDTVLITHTVTAAEAGLTILTSPFAASGGANPVDVGCSTWINGGGGGHEVKAGANESASATNLDRATLAAGDVVQVACHGSGNVTAQLLLERVSG
jgi:hypothetical protein